MALVRHMVGAALAAVLVVAAPAAAGPAPPPGAAGPERDISVQGVVTLLARRYSWIWEVPPNQLRVQEVRDGGGRARLVWVSRPASSGQAARHAFALLFRAQDGRRDVFVDLTPALEVGAGEPVPAAVQLAPGETGFVVGVRATPARPLAALHVIVVPNRAVVSAGEAVALSVEGELVALEQDSSGRLRVRVGRWEPAAPGGGVLELPGPREAVPGGRPVRAVAVTTYTYQPERRGFEAGPRTLTLTAFGVAEAFLEAIRQQDMARALALTSAEWRRVMGVSTPEQLRAYLEASRPGLLRNPGSFRYLGGSIGEEAASVLFADASGRIYRIRLRAASPGRDEMMLLPGQGAQPAAGAWEVDGLDGGG